MGQRKNLSPQIEPMTFYTELKIYLKFNFLATLLILAVCRMHVIREPCNAYDPARHESFVAQWLEYSTGLWKVIGSIRFGDSDFFFVPCL